MFPWLRYSSLNATKKFWQFLRNLSCLGNINRACFKANCSNFFARGCSGSKVGLLGGAHRLLARRFFLRSASSNCSVIERGIKSFLSEYSFLPLGLGWALRLAGPSSIFYRYWSGIISCRQFFFWWMNSNGEQSSLSDSKSCLSDEPSSDG